MDAFVGWFWGTGWFWVVVFWVGLVVNGRAVFKLLLDWRGMLTTWRFVDAAYRRLAALPPWQQKQLWQLAMPGEGRKAHQLNWALRPELLRTLLEGQADPARVWVGVSDADSIPDRNTYRWIAADVLTGGGRAGDASR